MVGVNTGFTVGRDVIQIVQVLFGWREQGQARQNVVTARAQQARALDRFRAGHDAVRLVQPRGFPNWLAKGIV